MEIPKITLKAARINAGLTQKAAAARLGINRATLQNYEDGSTIPNWELVRKIEVLYQYPADYIFFNAIPL